jgi:putative transposase
MRKDLLTNGKYYHIFNRSIAKYEIFKKEDDCTRFVQILDLYKFVDFQYKFSNFSDLDITNQKNIINNLIKNRNMHVKIFAYCIMPTHFHLILQQQKNNGISKYMAKSLNSYSRFFNTRYQRKGPLWEGKFKSILIDNDEQLLHLTRYIHLNPVSANIIEKTEDWKFSSYNEYLGNNVNQICKYPDLFDLTQLEYKRFVTNQISYQKSLSKIKHLLIENYSG